jgi:hypothetical protein
MTDFHVAFRELLHAVNLRYGTHSFTFLPKKGVLRIIFALKNPTVSAGFEPVNLGSKGQYATCRPPKPLSQRFRVSQAVFLLLVCVFMARAGRNSAFTVLPCIVIYLHAVDLL